MTLRKNSSIRAYALLTVLLSSPINANIYERIVQENIKTLPPLTPTTDDLSSLIKDDKYFEDLLEEKLKKQLHPTAVEKRTFAFTLLSQHEQHNNAAQEALFDTQSWQDLELLCGSKSNLAHYVADKIDRTTTEVGRVLLYKKIVSPTDNIEQLQQQQTTIKKLVAEPTLFSAADDVIKKIGAEENALISFWADEDIFYTCMVQDKKSLIPFSESLSKKLEKNSFILELRNKLAMFEHGTLLSMACIGTVLLPITGIAILTNHDSQTDLTQQTKNLELKSMGMFSVSSLLSHLIKLIRNNSYTKGMSYIATGLATGASVPWQFHELKAHIIFDLSLQKKLIKVATYLKHAQKLDALLQADPILKKSTCAQNLHNARIALNKKESTKRLVELLQSNTFTGKASIFSWIGKVEAAYKLMYESKADLAQLMIAVGECDLHLAIARLYNEHTNKQNRYCFATFEQSNSPFIHAKQFWNPLVSEEKNVLNSLALGTAGHAPHAIITGPNAGGKSTVMRSYVIAAIIAQSLTIAPCTELHLTPFSRIATYFNIVDDTAAGNSHFKAGVLRARELVRAATTLPAGKWCLMAIDELFNGTDPVKGEIAAYSLVKMIGEYKNTICATTTHFPKIATLGNSPLFENYKVSTSTNEAGKMEYSYFIEPGVSDQIVTFDILKEHGFDDQFLETARAIATEQE
jgi:DNA mismatch repair protein MutS